MANGTAFISERSKDAPQRAAWPRFLGRRRVARKNDSALPVTPVEVSPQLEYDAVSLVDARNRAETVLVATAETLIEADSADFFLRESHTLVAELRIVVATRIAFFTTDR